MKNAAVLFLLAFGFAGVVCADDTKTVLAKAMDKTGKVVFGELVSDLGGVLTIVDLETKAKYKLIEADMLSVSKNVSDPAAIREAGLQTILAYRLGKLGEHQAQPIVSKIAKITPTSIYLTAGSTGGLRVGQKLTVYRMGETIVDPDTNKVIASERSRIATIEVIDAREKFSKAKLTGNFEVKLDVGDLAELPATQMRVAVFPLVNTDGEATDEGNALTEQLITELVGRKITVVERSLLPSVLTELAIQQSSLFESKTAQKVGKQLGATVVLTGRIVNAATRSEAHVRLINVESGEIVLAGSTKLATRTVAKTNPSIKNPGPAAANKSFNTRNGSPPPNDRIISEDERKQGVYLARTYFGDVDYKVAVKPAAPKVKLFDTWISFKVFTEPRDSTGKIKISIDYGKTWIELDTWDPGSLRDIARNKNWRHISLRAAGASRTAKREIAKLGATEVDEIRVKFERGNFGGLGIETVVWWK